MTTGVFYIKQDKIILQGASYIEDGWYIEIDKNIKLFEIPNGGGTPIEIGKFNTIIEAIESSNNLT